MHRLIGLLITLLVFTGAATLAQDQTTLTLVTHDSFSVSEDVLAAFEDETGITLRILRSGDAGAMVNQSVLSKENPLGDVMFGVDNTFLTRALDADLFLAYESPLLEHLPEELLIDPEFRVTPVDFGDVCLNYDVQYFAANDLVLPATLADLTAPMYQGLLAVENPATSSPGLAFLLATVVTFGTEGDYTYLDFWTDLVANDVLIADDWSDAYFGQFTIGSGGSGERPLVVSYASSPPAEVFFSEATTATAPTGSIVADGACFRQVEFAGILNGTENLEAARQLIDFMLSVQFQEDVPLQMFVFPVRQDAALPEVFTEHAAIPDNPVTMDISEIDANREVWIEAWVETVLR